MLFHPHTLDLIFRFKQNADASLLKEILALITDSEPNFNREKLYDIIFSYSKIKKTKKQNLEILNNCLEANFSLVEGEKSKGSVYILNDFEGLSSEGRQLIKKRRKQNLRKESLNKKKEEINVKLDQTIEDKSVEEDLISKFIELDALLTDYDHFETNNRIFFDNKNILVNLINKILAKLSSMQEIGAITKREHSNIVNSIKLTAKTNGSEPSQVSNLSLLNFVTKEKRKTIEIDSRKKFVPIVFDSNVYVYKINNPNFHSLRRRKDLVNPKKMMFIKFSEDIKPPIYKQTDNQLKHKISYEKIFDSIDYDEESTWEDDPDAESIDSEESEEEDSSSEACEFIEADSGEQEKRKIKKPMLIFPNVKIEINKEFDPIFLDLPLVPSKTISDLIKNKIKNEFINSEDPLSLIKKLSKKYMVVENTLKEFYETVK